MLMYMIEGLWKIKGLLIYFHIMTIFTNSLINDYKLKQAWCQTSLSSIAYPPTKGWLFSICSTFSNSYKPFSSRPPSSRNHLSSSPSLNATSWSLTTTYRTSPSKGKTYSMAPLSPPTKKTQQQLLERRDPSTSTSKYKSKSFPLRKSCRRLKKKTGTSFQSRSRWWPQWRSPSIPRINSTWLSLPSTLNW